MSDNISRCLVNPLSHRDDSRDGGGRTKFGTRVERVGAMPHANKNINRGEGITIDNSLFLYTPSSPPSPGGRRGLDSRIA